MSLSRRVAKLLAQVLKTRWATSHSRAQAQTRALSVVSRVRITMKMDSEDSAIKRRLKCPPNSFSLSASCSSRFSLAPLAATFISVRYKSYSLSFAAAAVGMALSLIVFQMGKRHLLPAHAGNPKTVPSGEDSLAVSSRAEDGQRITALFTLFIIAIFFWVAFYQNGSSLTLFAERSTVRLSWLKPETYQVFNPLFILLLTPVIVAVFGRMRKKGMEPSSASKIFAGMVVMGFSVLIMVFASRAGGNLDHNLMSPWWLISSYFAVTKAT